MLRNNIFNFGEHDFSSAACDALQLHILANAHATQRNCSPKNLQTIIFCLIITLHISMSGCFATICVFFEVKPKNIFRNVISTQEEGRRIFLGFTIHIDQIFTRNPRCTSLLLSKRRTEQKSEDSSFSTKTILLHNSQLLFWFLFECFFLFLETFCLLYRQLFFPQSRYFGSFSLSNNSLNTTL